MTWNLFGQYLDILLASVLVIRIFGLNLQVKYLACLAFIVFDSCESLVYILDIYLFHHGVQVFDYRVLWALTQLVSWTTTIWLVYSLLTAILKQLPGILRFSLKFLNIVFVCSVVIAFVTVGPEYAASDGILRNASWLTQLSVLTGILGRALSLAELLSILCVLAFVLRFPIRVPSNLAAFSAGLSIYLFLKIGFLLLRTYLALTDSWLTSTPGYFMAGCLIYWICCINSAGEEVPATLGRAWRTVPQEHLVRQLEAMNAALLRSREQV